MVSLLASSALAIQRAQANFKPAPLPHVYIQSDGSIDPVSAPMSRNGNVYALTGNLSGFVLDIRRSNAVFDGAGFSIPGTGHDYAILLTGVSNVTVKNFIITDRNVDIHLNASSYCTIAGNRMSSASSYGIWLSDRSDNNVISDNVIDRCYYGIYLGYSRNNVLRNNTVFSQPDPAPRDSAIEWPPLVIGVNFAVDGSALEDYVNDVDASNTVDGKPVNYWVNRRNAEVPPNAGYVALVNCTGITVQNQNLTKNKHGVLLAWTTASTVRGNSVHFNAVGIYLFHSHGNTVANNSAYASHSNEENEDHGIRIQSSYNNIISGNTATFNRGAGICVSESPGTRLLDNYVRRNSDTGIMIINRSNQSIVFRNHFSDNSGVALRVADCTRSAIVANSLTENRYYDIYLTGTLEGTRIYGNTFGENKIQGTPRAFVSATDANPTWDNGTMGNYWSDYLTLHPNASEIGASGIGDAPYVIDENNVDHFPLMTPPDASTISVPKIASAPLPTPTPEPSPTPTPPSSLTATPDSSPSMSPPQTEQPTPTLNPSSSPSLSENPLRTEQPTASEEQPQAGSNTESPSTMYVVIAVVSIATIALVTAAVMLRRIHSGKAAFITPAVKTTHLNETKET